MERIVRGECAAAGTPANPEFDYYDQYPLTRNGPGVTDTLSVAFVEHFGPRGARGQPGHGVGGLLTHPGHVRGARRVLDRRLGRCRPLPGRAARGAVSQDIPANHAPHFAPEEEPTLLSATRAQVVAALAYLGAERRVV
ncbi:hypothetical protein [Dietzia cinnamea]|uniref:hypothetical protein n=1 Tax=Dietzia cinnamea TaxID=321318 RepID=UPI0021A4D84E|nr:hypothetical protein [Dietzia cinnamea]MCT2141242.1 hypothetical protein [Dietzia cinnamea]